MKKLIFATLGLIVLLLISIVARNANFNIKTLMESNFGLTSSATPSAHINVTESNPTTPVEIYITLTPYGFVPDALMIQKGTKITWINKSGKDATVQMDTPLQDFQSLTFGNNNTIFYTFSQLGRYGYFNKQIPTQHAVIIVN
ncbi:MAG TPA: hypothetical protein VN711_03410 [Candidatus Saccharimonadales bacterium]|nr:hypothetical protein [Candidatus Saccharimonadales bacterium]